METPQQAEASFFGPTAAAYLAACVGWLIVAALLRKRWPRNPLETTRPYLDFVLCLAAAGGIFALGSAYRAGWLLPTGDGWQGKLNWTIDNLIIYSPIAIVLLLRRQGPATIFLSTDGLPYKLGSGLVLGVGAVLVYLAARGELDRATSVLTKSIDADNLVNFLPVFLEGVVLAFLFVRLRWAFGLTVALLLPAALFALAHVPRQIEGERTLYEMAAFFVFNTGLVSAILFTVQRSQDIIWMGIVHYLMDIAIEAF
jgi:hypothetical protein